MQLYLEHFDPREVNSLAKLLIELGSRGSSLFVAGNGGSASTASHMMTDLFSLSHKYNFKVKVNCLSDNSSLITAHSNDFHFNEIFSEQIKFFGKIGDLLIVISASGNSPNLISAINVANNIGMSTFAILGFDGGKIKDIVSDYILVKTNLGDYGPAEDIHLIINHMLKEEIVNILNTENLDAQEI